MAEVTVIIPIGMTHTEIAQRAIDSVVCQTRRADLLTEIDTLGLGPAALRNRMLRQVATPFVVFLDADDWIAPTFVERTLAVWHGRYVYTDWYEDEALREAPEMAWCGGAWHIVTALLPTDWARAVGGFDETLIGMEDTDFYMKLVTTGRCGVRLPEPLFYYSNDGARSDAFRADPTYEAVKAEVHRRYRGLMGCCGRDAIAVPPIGEKQPGDVLAEAQWAGNRTVAGRVTGRVYPRASRPKQVWVDPRDAAAAPAEWRIVEATAVDETPIFDLAGVDDMLANVGILGSRGPVRYQPLNEVPAATGRPDLRGVIEKGRKR